MKTLEVKQDNAIKAYKGTDANGRKLLTDLFGSENLNQKIADRVKTYEDACELLGIIPVVFPVNLVPHGLLSDVKSLNAYCKLTIIIRALNEGWEPNWDNSSEYKYYPYFQHKAGVGFSITHYVHWSTYSAVGSRLCLKSSELAMYAGKQFEDIYNDFLTL